MGCCKSSARNKAILVPAALLISAVANWAIIPSLMLCGPFLARVGHGILMAAVSNEVFEVVAGGIAVFAIDGAKAAWKALATGKQNP